MDPSEVRGALQGFSDAEKREALAGVLPDPDPRTTNWIWLIVVLGIVLVLVGAAAFLGLAFWADPAGDNARVKAETLLALFTGAIGFLAGLFSPSPVEKK